MRVLENITYNELQIGDYATFTKTLSDDALVLFAASSGEISATALNLDAAKKAIHKKDIGFGMWASSLISTAFSKVIPGPGSIYLEQQLIFNQAVQLDDTLTVKLTVQEKLEHSHVIFQCEVVNQNGDLVVQGESRVIAPTEKISLDQEALPRIKVEQ